MTREMDDGRRKSQSLSSSSCIPLFSRLHRSDSTTTMKYLEEKQHLLEEKSDLHHKQCVSMDLAIKEAHLKGSLLDRITWLEHRLHKLSMELESGSMQAAAVGSTSSTHGCNHKELSSSFPVFTTRKQPSQSQLHNSDYQGKSDRGQQKLKKQGKKKNRSSKEDDKTSKWGKKEKPSIWPRFKILGC